MKIKLKPRQDKFLWHWWFAWHPVRVVCVDGLEHIVWLQWVERRAYVVYGGGIGWHYR